MAQQRPTSTEPGLIEKQLEKPAKPKAAPPLAIPETETPAPPPGAADIRFVLKGIKLFGNTVYRDEDLLPLWGRFLDKEVSLTDIFSVAVALTVKYRNDGYILSRALVPPQEIVDGVVEIEVIEGFIDNVIIEGEPTGPIAQFKEKAEKIKASRPLRANVLERYMLLVNDMPGVSGQSILRPSPTEPGASELIIVLEESKVTGSVLVNNRGTRYVGPYQGVATLTLDNVFGRYESTEIRAVGTQDTEELRFLALTHTELLSTEGTTVSLTGSFARTEPGSTLKSSRVKGTSTSFGAFVSYPAIRTRSLNLSLVGALQYRNSRTKVLGVEDSHDRLRMASIGGTLDFVDGLRGINLIGLQATQGLNILGARKGGSANLTRSDGRSDFTKFTANISREQPLASGVSLFAAASGQYALSQLLASEEYGFGGGSFGRGYDPFEISGDHGASFKLEIQYGAASETELVESYQLFASWDLGTVWRIDKDRDPRDSAASVAIGARANLAFDMSGSVTMAYPLTRPPTTDRDDLNRQVRLFFQLTKRF